MKTKHSAVTTWTAARLTRLFDRYRLRYWPRSRRLRRFRIESTALKGPLGQCRLDDNVIAVDVRTHRHDREVRATVLHEMIHAVIGRAGHDAPFWRQMDHLRSRKAPIKVGFPEVAKP